MLYRRIAYLSLPALAFMAGAAVAAPVGAPATPDGPPPAVRFVDQTVIVAPSAPPAPRAEIVPPPPVTTGALAYWQPGHWSWTNAGWVWVGGVYVTPSQPRTAWVPGQWVTQPGGGYVWMDGHWQS